MFAVWIIRVPPSSLFSQQPAKRCLSLKALLVTSFQSNYAKKFDVSSKIKLAAEILVHCNLCISTYNTVKTACKHLFVT